MVSAWLARWFDFENVVERVEDGSSITIVAQFLFYFALWATILFVCVIIFALVLSLGLCPIQQEDMRQMRLDGVTLLSVCGLLLMVASRCVGNPLSSGTESAVRLSGSSARGKSLWSPLRRQYTDEDCTEDEDCAEPRKCLNERRTACVEDQECKCTVGQQTKCSTEKPCLAGDLCYLRQEDDEGICYSCKFRKDQEKENRKVVGETECVCIAIASLTHLRASELVFAAHRRAAVLCDSHGNCATPGHIVVFRNVPMAMATYCARPDAACVRTVRLVNSPRMKLGLRIPSFRDGLHFTALAAARETALEEALLKLAVSVGV